MSTDLTPYISLIRTRIHEDYVGMYREAGGTHKYPFITPGSKDYADVLWDWDSWWTDIALRQILLEKDDAEESENALAYGRGCVLNFLDWCDFSGWIPIRVGRGEDLAAVKPNDIYATNMHKPCLAQHAAFLVREANGDAEWLRESNYPLQKFVNNYRNHRRHRPTGLYFWQDCHGIGVDTDPCTFFRPKNSSGSIYLNCFMYKELEALAYLCDCLNLGDVAGHFRQDADKLRDAVQEHCWDERDGFFYSVDLNLLPNTDVRGLHENQPRDYECLIQRIGVWSGFLAMWAGLATEEQAERMVKEHLHDERTFNAPFGVRTLSKMEKMYNLRASGNPSSWMGPIWGISNYMVWRGLINYGFEDDARELAEKTITLFGRDFERFGALHEYYQPENGEPILNRGFQNWNYLVLNMAAWYEGRPTVAEF